jgi:hypothetical protein
MHQISTAPSPVKPAPFALARSAALVLGLLCALTDRASAQLEIPPAVYPKLAAEAADIAGFVPSGWIVEAQASTDFNRDGAPDLVFVLRQKDPRNVIDNKGGLGVSSLDTNPRIVAAAFKTSTGYRLALENQALIPRNDNSTVDDTFDAQGGLSAERGSFKILLTFFASAGSWEMGPRTLTFRLQGKDFVLIGYDRTSVTRSTGKLTTISINYLTGRMLTQTGTISSDDTTKSWKTLPKRPPPTIAEVGDGMEFDPLGR